MAVQSPPTDQLTKAPRRGPRRLKLRVEDGPDHGRELLLEVGSYLVGKGEENDLVLTDGSVSRAHLMVEVGTDGVRLSDRGSTNGSSCDGLRFTTVEARAGSVITLGRTVLRLLSASEQAEPLAPSRAERFGALLGSSLTMRRLFAVLERIAPVDGDVLVQGETGTGKELCARALHERSPRAKGPFVVCDLSTLTPSLLESELFGHVRGAFTGAEADREGAFERARGGTLFLDEVGELPLESQPRLLRFLERRELRRLGDNRTREVDVRVVAATRRELEAEVRAGRFREDLYFRLAVLNVRLPPLRERAEDVELLMDASLRERGQSPELLSPETRALLSAYAWPGNVRELRNVVERAVALGESAAVEVAAPSAGAARAGQPPLPFKDEKERIVTAFERDYVRGLLDSCGGNIRRAAELAGIDRAHLYRLMHRHGLERSEP